MSDFIFVHGSGQNAASWSRVGDLLKRRGHSVAAPELPKQASDWGLEDHAALIARSIKVADPVVVAHSLSGVFLPWVSQIRKCRLLVFLAAVIPEPGKSVRDQFADDPSMFSPAWIEAGARWFDPSQRESLSREFLFHDCDEDTISWALPTVVAIDSRPLVTQPAPPIQWPTLATASIVATEDRTLSPAWIRRTTRRLLQTEPIEIQAGHCPHVSRPTEIAGILERLATGPTA